MNIALVVLLPFLVVLQVNGQCWVGSYGRGAGKPVSSCPDSQDKDGALCYDKCRSGYYSVGPVCWSYCPSDLKDIGALCSRDAHIYSKGCCCVNFFGRKSCCNNCNDGYRDDGCTCRRDVKVVAKSSYGRGAGAVLRCRPDEVEDAGLCYPACRSGYKGVGPVCWSTGCSGAYVFNCGALCTLNADHCKEVTKTIAGDSITFAANMAGVIASGGATLADSFFSLASSGTGLAADLINDVCANPNQLQSHCMKPITSSGLGKCSGVNSADCGLFCANSPVICVKRVFVITSKITGLAAAIQGGLKGKTTDEEKDINAAKSFLTRYSPEKLSGLMKGLLKGSAKLSEDIQEVKAIMSGVNTLLSLGSEASTNCEKMSAHTVIDIIQEKK